MNKRFIKLLIIAGIVSAVNLNASYCMEYKNESQIYNTNELQFKEIYINYNKARTNNMVLTVNEN